MAKSSDRCSLQEVLWWMPMPRTLQVLMQSPKWGFLMEMFNQRPLLELMYQVEVCFFLILPFWVALLGCWLPFLVIPDSSHLCSHGHGRTSPEEWLGVVNGYREQMGLTDTQILNVIQHFFFFLPGQPAHWFWVLWPHIVMWDQFTNLFCKVFLP